MGFLRCRRRLNVAAVACVVREREAMRRAHAAMTWAAGIGDAVGLTGAAEDLFITVEDSDNTRRS